MECKVHRPHDLLWLKKDSDFGKQVLPDWVYAQWKPDFPVVVRRDYSPSGLIPIGIRGRKRSQRVAAWISPSQVEKSFSPEDIVAGFTNSWMMPFQEMKPIKALQLLIRENLKMCWGPTGSCAYALLTREQVMHDESDLDLLVRCKNKVNKDYFIQLVDAIDKLPCRADVQVETPFGAFALKEWMRMPAGRVLLKTDKGPLMTSDPWHEILG